MEYEVIVVGAGPAGAAAASALAQRGRKVLLLDRQQFPRDKSCGDAIPALAIQILHELGLQEKLDQAGFYPIHNMRLVSPRGYILDTDCVINKSGVDSLIAPRFDFDVLIQQHAVESGAEFQQALVKSPVVRDGQVVGVQARVNGQTREISAPVVIGADGATSVIGRALRPKQQENGHRAIALRAYIDDLELLPHTVEFYLSQDILPGYAWIFPLGDNRANIGWGIRLDKYRQRKLDLNQMLSSFLAIPSISERLKNGGQLRDVAAWQLNFGSQRRIQRAFAGAVLIGDAGSFINPLTGGGIHNALLSAQIAADVVDKALESGDISQRTLGAYEKHCHQALWSDMRLSYLFQRLLSFPILVDFLIRQATANSQLTQIFVKKL